MNRPTLNTMLLCTALSFGACAQDSSQVATSTDTVYTDSTTTNKIMKTDAEWKELLTAEQYRILREKGTERAFTGEFWDDKSECSYLCAGCGLELFESDTKFKSGSGWPSFHSPASEGAVEEHRDGSHGMERTEVVCSRCGGHLGHIFPDGPEPTGQRYCINSASLKKVEK